MSFVFGNVFNCDTDEDVFGVVWLMLEAPVTEFIPAFGSMQSNVILNSRDGSIRRSKANQSIGTQLLSVADGSAFTGTASVYLTGDGGSQSSVGSATHKGNGYHSYTPSLDNTKHWLAAFTFIASGAVPVTIQSFTKPRD